jgi:hypothetical protein
LVICAVSHREVDAAFIDSLLRLFLRVHGGGNNLNPFFLEPGCFGKSRQLLLAIRSPVAPIEEHRAPLTGQIVWQAHGSTAHLVELEMREGISSLVFRAPHR